MKFGAKDAKDKNKVHTCAVYIYMCVKMDSAVAVEVFVFLAVLCNSVIHDNLLLLNHVINFWLPSPATYM